MAMSKSMIGPDEGPHVDRTPALNRLRVAPEPVPAERRPWNACTDEGGQSPGATACVRRCSRGRRVSQRPMAVAVPTAAQTSHGRAVKPVAAPRS